MIYFIQAVLLFGLMLLYFRIADKFNIIDKPNERSSHSVITLRGGGILFPVSCIVWACFNGLEYPWFLLGLVMIATISFIDDIMTLPNKPRLIVHFISVLLMFYQAGIFGLEWYWWIIALILSIGWINAFNFMDGINAITAFYAITSLLTFAYLNYEHEFVSGSLIWVVLIAAAIFALFNARKRARTFAGDVGSVSMAFILGFLMMSLILSTQHWEYLLFFAIYGVDAVLTIFHRLLKKENMFLAHRSHLYQYLANELKMPHVFVSSIYALIQMLINVVVIWAVGKDAHPSMLSIGILVLLAVIYILLKRSILSRQTPAAALQR